MKPVLFSEKDKHFDTNGLGVLSDVISCFVTEERNDGYTLEMVYPTKGKHFEKIKENSQIVVTVSNGSRQVFVVRGLTTTFDGKCEIYAEHISYKLNGIPVNAFSGTGIKNVMSQIKGKSVVNNPFTFQTDNDSTVKWSIKAPRSCRTLLGGAQGSLLDVYGGEFEWDNTTVKLWKSRGEEKPITIQYGKDLTDLTDDVDGTNAVTGVYPYYQNEDTVVVGDVVRAGIDAPERIVTEEISQYMNIEGEAVPTKAQVTEAGRIALANKYISATENLKVSFVPVWQAEEYKSTMQSLNLCDTITVRYDKLGIQRKTKVVKTVWDVLLDRYESIELGDIKTGLVGSIIGIKGSVVNVKETLKQEIQDTANEIYEYTDETIEETKEEILEEVYEENDKIKQEFRAKDGELVSRIEQNKSDSDNKFSQIYQDIDTIEFTVSSTKNRVGTLESTVTIQAGQISQKVSKNNIISEINQSPEQVTIDASRIKLTGITTLTDGSSSVTVNGNSLNMYPGGCYISWNSGVLNLSSTGEVWVSGSRFRFNGADVATK